MRMKGLEPSRPKALEPKSSASTNSATSAKFHNDINYNRQSNKNKQFIKNYRICDDDRDLVLAKHS